LGPPCPGGFRTPTTRKYRGRSAAALDPAGVEISCARAAVHATLWRNERERDMRAGYYERNRAARDVLQVGGVEPPRPGPGEVRIGLATSGVNPSDVKSRAGLTRKIAFPRVIPHSDGAGIIDMVGDGVPAARTGERVWTWNAQWKRAFGTCAEYVVLPAPMAVALPQQVTFEEGACLGIPAMTAFHAIAVADAWAGSTLLVSGGAGAVGNYAIQFAKARGAVVITTVSSDAKA